MSEKEKEVQIMSYDMRPIRKDLNEELIRLAKQHTVKRKRLEWLDKDILGKLRERNRLESEAAEIDLRIAHLKETLEGARK